MHWLLADATWKDICRTTCLSENYILVKFEFLSHHTVVCLWGILSLLCAILFVCTVTDFSTVEKDMGVKFCMHVRLLSGQVFSPLVNFGSWGVTAVTALLPGWMAPEDPVPRTVAWSFEIGVALLLKAVWWGLILASLLTHLFLANVNSRSRSLYAVARPSVCRLSVTLVHPTQAVEIFRNISTAVGTLAILWHPLKISRRSSHGNPSTGGVKHKRGSKI